MIAFKNDVTRGEIRGREGLRGRSRSVVNVLRNWVIGPSRTMPQDQLSRPPEQPGDPFGLLAAMGALGRKALRGNRRLGPFFDVSLVYQFPATQRMVFVTCDQNSDGFRREATVKA